MTSFFDSRIFYILIGIVIVISLYQMVYCVHRRKILAYYDDLKRWSLSHSIHEHRVDHHAEASKQDDIRHTYRQHE